MAKTKKSKEKTDILEIVLKMVASILTMAGLIVLITLIANEYVKTGMHINEINDSEFINAFFITFGSMIEAILVFGIAYSVIELLNYFVYLLKRRNILFILLLLETLFIILGLVDGMIIEMLAFSPIVISGFINLYLLKRKQTN